MQESNCLKLLKKTKKKNSRLTPNQLKHRAPVSQIKIRAGDKQMRRLIGNMFHGTTTYPLFLKLLEKATHLFLSELVERCIGTGNRKSDIMAN